MRKRYVVMVVLLASACVSARAQEAEPRGNVAFRTNTFQFVGPEATISGKVVKGAPYSATAVTETVQTLPDGNRLTQQISSFLARDSEGRTRREQSLPMLGPWSSEGPAQKLVTINDPVSGASYMLDEHDKTARKLPAVDPRGLTAQKLGYERMVRIQGQTGTVAGAPGVVMVRSLSVAGSKAEAEDRKEEKLGQTTIEGVAADGVRTTTVLPAGAVGNERPITITDERWYSPELQTTVLTKHSDPRMGETTFKLTNISRSEPSATLFQVPPEYQVSDAPTKDGMDIKVEKK